MDAFTGEIRIFCGTYAPLNWAYCDGSLLKINEYSTLFSVIGTTYGGNGTLDFGLPNLNGCVPIGAGQSPGLSNYTIGQSGGSKDYTLNNSTLPSHTHHVTAASSNALEASPQGNFAAAITFGKKKINKYHNTANDTFNAFAINQTGKHTPTPVSNLQPYLPLFFIICLEGHDHQYPL